MRTYITYAGAISNWFSEVGYYRSNHLKKWQKAGDGVRYAVYEWKYASRILVLDINETVRVFYRIDFPGWLEPLCYSLGWVVQLIAFGIGFHVASKEPFLLFLGSLSLLSALLLGAIDLVPVIVSEILKQCADEFHWKKVNQEAKNENLDLKILKNKIRCSYFAWLIIDCHPGNNQLNEELKKSNEIMNRLGLEFRVGMNI